MKPSVSNHLFTLIAGSLLAAAATFGATQALAQSDTTMSQESKDFITKAAQGNLGEIVMGTRVQNKTENPDISQFGLRLVEDHSTANQELKPIAEANGVPWPEKPKEKQRELEDKLSQLSGAEFDKKFMEEMVKDHEKDVKEYEKMADKVENKQLKEYVQKTLPVLKKHLEIAKSIEKSLGDS